MRRVLIGTPALTGEVTAWYADSLYHSGLLCQSQGIHLAPIFIALESNLPNARNDLLAIAIRQGFDDLIFIDADQEWKPEYIPRLLSHPVDCVGAAIRKKTDTAELYNVRAPDGPLSFVVHPETDLWTAEGMCLGTGFLRLSRAAMQMLWDNAEPYSNGKAKEPSRWVFDFRPINGELVGEDTLLCMKLQEFGIDTWLDPTMVVGHVGTKKWTGDFANWLGRMQDQERAKVPMPHPKAA